MMEQQQLADCRAASSSKYLTARAADYVFLPSQPTILTCPSTFENNARVSPRNSTTQSCANLKIHTVYLSAIQQ
jgi:hypothetical protein